MCLGYYAFTHTIILHYKIYKNEIIIFNSSINGTINNLFCINKK